MECWGNYCYIPWPVEVAVDSVSGWTVWLPFAGSVVLFVASMITLSFTIRSTNERAEADRQAAQQRANDDREAAMARVEADRDAARERDRNSWRRDTLLRVATEALSATVAASEQYRKVPDSPDNADVDVLLDSVTAAGAVILAASTTLGVMGVTESASECRYLYGAATDAELQQLVRSKARWDQNGWDRFAELLGQIGHRAGIFSQIIGREIGEPTQKLPANPFRT